MKKGISEVHRVSLIHLNYSLWLAIALAGLCPGARAYESNLRGEWHTYGNGPAHTGYFPGTLNGLPFVQKWKAPMPSGHVTQPAIGGGRVFVTTGWYFGPMALIAMDANTGVPLWTNNFVERQSINPPTYDNGAVYMHISDGFNNSPAALIKFDAVTHATNWAATWTGQGYDYMAPVVVNDTVYSYTGYSTELSGFNRTNGTKRFTIGLYGYGCDSWTPAYYGGKVYTWVNGWFTEHNPTTGARNWDLTNGTSSEFLYSMRRTLAAADGRAYFTSTTKLMAVDLIGHTNLWSVTGAYSGTPAVANGVVYAISNRVVNAFTTNGVFVRSYIPTNNSYYSYGYGPGQLIVTDDVLIAAGLYGIDVFRLADGALIQYLSSAWRYPNEYYSSDIALAHDTLYISSGTSNLYAFSSSNLVKFTITSSTNLGSPAPHPYGTNYVILGQTVSNTVPGPLYAPSYLTRYQISGWSGTGSVPESGNTNTVTFVATNDSTLTWNFKTEHFLDTEKTASVYPWGYVDVADSWVEAGSAVTITATPTNYYHFANWSGDVSGTSNVIQVVMDAPKLVKANFAENLVTNNTAEWWLAYYSLPVNDAGALADTDGDGDPNWKEYFTGTNPTNAASVFRLTVIPWGSNPKQIQLKWPSSYSRKYRVLETTNLGGGLLPIATNIYGNPPYNYYYRTISSNDQGFYSILAE